ncbi:MAG: hypothetical protein KDI56_17615, partial [Xanthomonadales bacterium]|nr:hypothetical protein [Xanthomonadales bacterium]
FSQSPLGLVQLRDRYISPNGDGRQDVLVVEYETYQAMNLEFEIRNDRDELVFAHADAVTAAGSYTFEWSGMGPSGALVSDGAYVMALNNRRLDFVIDTNPPILTPYQPGEDGLPGETVCDFETTASAAEGYRVWVEPSPPLEVAARESNWESIRLQVRGHDPSSAWIDAISPHVPDEEEVYAQWRFPSGQWVTADRRVVAEDKAGNVSILPSEIAKPFISSMRSEERSIGDNQMLPSSWSRQGLGYQVPVINISGSARLERVLLEVIDPRHQGGPVTLRYTSDGVTFATIDLLDVTSEYQESSTPGGRCVGPGARVFAAEMPPLSPGSWVRFILSTGVGLDDFERAVQGEAFDVRIEFQACQFPHVEKEYCELFSPEEVIVPLLWCPEGIDREFGADSPLNPSIRWLSENLRLPLEGQLVAAGAPGCPDNRPFFLSECPEGYDCSCARLPLTALPDGDVYSLNAVPDELVGQLGLEFPTWLPKMYGKVSPDLPTIVLEGPVEG